MKSLNSCVGLLALCASLCLSNLSYAQIEKGAWLFSGGSNLGNTSITPSGGSSSSVFNINLKGGYFFTDNLAGGALLDVISYSGSSTTTTFKANSSSALGFSRIAPAAGVALRKFPLKQAMRSL